MKVKKLFSCIRVDLLCLTFLCAACSSNPLSNGGRVHAPDPTQVIPQIDTTNLLPANIPYAGSIVPNTNVQITPTIGVPMETLVSWGAYAAAAYLILDPLAPNWSIEEARFPDDYFHLSLEMKRYYSGGAGEARVVFHRRAKDLMRAGGYGGYQVVEYTEGLESSVLGSKRVAHGVVRLTKQPG